MIGVPVQMPPPQVSPAVQLLPSSQAFVLLTKTQPVSVSQLSLVHGLLSLQTIGEWTQPTPAPVCIRIVPVVLPDMPPSGPPGLPTKSMR